jgi:hypothetical protein
LGGRKCVGYAGWFGGFGQSQLWKEEEGILLVLSRWALRVSELPFLRGPSSGKDENTVTSGRWPVIHFIHVGFGVK